MKRRINQTGRLRLTGKHVAISLEEGPPRTADVALDLDGLELPAGARVYIEAYSRVGFQLERFDFGTVSEPVTDQPLVLTRVTSSSPLFRVKVVDVNQHPGRLLAEGDTIAPESPGQACGEDESMLHVDFSDLGELVWRLTYGSGGPLLELDHKVTKDQARNDPVFRALVYPSVFMDILEHAQRLADDPEADWVQAWLKFGRSMARQDPPANGADDELDPEWQQWTAEAVAGFCRAHKLATEAAKIWRRQGE